MVFFHYSLDISLHQSTPFTLGFHLYSVHVLLIMQSWYTQTIIMYLTASAGDLLYSPTSHQQTPDSKKSRESVKSHSVNSVKPHNWQAACCDRLAYEEVIYTTCTGKRTVSVSANFRRRKQRHSPLPHTAFEIYTTKPFPHCKQNKLMRSA